MHTRNVLRRLLLAPVLSPSVTWSLPHELRKVEWSSPTPGPSGGSRRPCFALRDESLLAPRWPRLARLLSTEALDARHLGRRRRRFTDRSHDRWSPRCLSAYQVLFAACSSADATSQIRFTHRKTPSCIVPYLSSSFSSSSSSSCQPGCDLSHLSDFASMFEQLTIDLPRRESYQD